MTALHVFESNSVRRGVHELCKRKYCVNVQYANQQIYYRKISSEKS